MRFGLASFLGGFLKSPKPTKQKHRASSRRRQLLAEPLESRFALSTLDGGVVMPDEPVIPSDPVSSLTSPSGADPSLPPTNPPVDPPPVNFPPIIHDLTCTLEGTWYVVSGWVSDNVDPTGYTVQLSGVISASVMVAADDHFSYVFQFDPQLHGAIFALTHDMQGLLSNEPFVNI